MVGPRATSQGTDGREGIREGAETKGKEIPAKIKVCGINSV